MSETIYQRGTFRLELVEEGELAMVRLNGEFTDADSAPLEKVLIDLASSRRGALVDLTGVRYIPSKIIPPLASAAVGASFFGVVGVPSAYERIFKLVGKQKSIRVFINEESAYAAFLALGDARGQA